MNTYKRLAMVIALVLFGVGVMVAVTRAAPLLKPLAPDVAPTMVAYQG